MDCRTGEIYDHSIIERLIASGAIKDRARFKEMAIPPTPQQLEQRPPRINRDDYCPCGSGKIFKRCCMQNPNDERF
jgi:uncharacterized protein YchJ